MKIFFPIIAALILLCLGSCGYANYCKQPVDHNEDEEVDRHEEVYSLSKPDRPYLTPHYQECAYHHNVNTDMLRKMGLPVNFDNYFWRLCSKIVTFNYQSNWVTFIRNMYLLMGLVTNIRA